MFIFIIDELLTCPCRGVFLLLRQDEPGEGHAVGVHSFHTRHVAVCLTQPTNINSRMRTELVILLTEYIIKCYHDHYLMYNVVVLVGRSIS